MIVDRLKQWFDESVVQPILVPRLAARSRPLLILLGVLLLVLCGVLQPLLPADVAVELLYLVPVLTIAWAGGRRPGLAAAVAAAGGQLVIDSFDAGAHTSAGVAYGNFGLRLAMFVAVSELLPRLHQALDAARERARTDPLTGLGNRRFFEVIARAELARTNRYRRPLALGLIDVDFFKEVHDRLGHQAGDQLLQLIAREVRRVLRDSDTVARLGGDEFAVLLPETPADGADVAFRKVHGHLTAAVEREGFPVSFSLGVVTCDAGSSVPLETLIREADQTMYMVKNSGRGSLRLRPLRELSAAV
ncbi:MAG: GGDEF domain-containing protein [Gemmatimonadetes bacterium]|nr:GGDEF domain-containing protein [Gemmatimonadota bacterium]